MQIIEYPKALYRDGAYTAAAGPDEEREHRADRWVDWSADQARMKSPEQERKAGRTRAAKTN